MTDFNGNLIEILTVALTIATWMTRGIGVMKLIEGEWMTGLLCICCPYGMMIVGTCYFIYLVVKKTIRNIRSKIAANREEVAIRARNAEAYEIDYLTDIARCNSYRQEATKAEQVRFLNAAVAIKPILKSMNERYEELSSKTVVELKKLCKEAGLKGYTKFKKAELVRFVSENVR